MKIQMTTPQLLSSRNALLQYTLRGESRQAYPIEIEYPLVLSPEKTCYSFCGVFPEDPTRVVVHANLLPRTMSTCSFSIQVGLIGNVATDEAFRGKGWMRHLFLFLHTHAHHQGLDALILWSDLAPFYHKLGYMPFGCERRFRWTPSVRPLESHRFWVETKPGAELFSQLHVLRPPVPLTYQRTQEEWAALLQIPDTTLLLAFSSETNNLEGFCVMGKGYDMIGVVHEWGAKNAAVMEGLLQHILYATGWREITLLVPSELDTKWELWLESQEGSQHPVGLLHPLTPQAEALEKAFFWGLDGI